MISILICTLPERHQQLAALKSFLERQAEKFPGQVDIKVHDAGRSMSTGQKRNELISVAVGNYIGFCDDDDMVSEDYVSDIINATNFNPDVITFRGWMTTNGANRRPFTIKLGSEYNERDGHYYRFPNHLCYFNREKIKDVFFPHVWNQEDFRWATEIRNRRLLHSEYHIDKELYHYRFTDKKPGYGPYAIR